MKRNGDQKDQFSSSVKNLPQTNIVGKSTQGEVSSHPIYQMLATNTLAKRKLEPPSSQTHKSLILSESRHVIYFIEVAY